MYWLELLMDKNVVISKRLAPISERVGRNFYHDPEMGARSRMKSFFLLPSSFFISL